MPQQISIWEEESFYAKQDFIIVGAGFTGLWTALHLKKRFPNKKIAILEKGNIPTGASLRNAGFACFGSLTEILSDLKAMGVEKTLQLVNWRYLGLKMIREYFPFSLIDYSNCGGYELIEQGDLESEMDRVNRLLHAITGDSKTFAFENELIETFGFNQVGQLIKNKFEGALHSGKLLQNLKAHVCASGVQILYATELKQTEELKDGVQIFTDKDLKLSTEFLILCTNAYIKNFLPEIDLLPARGQVLLTEPIHNLKINGVFHFNEGFYYFRNLDNRILLGGARNTSFKTEFTFDNFTTWPIQQELEQFLTTVILPGQKPEITHRWAGIMGMGTDKYPIVERLTKRMSCAVRLSGMGVALAPIISQKLVEFFEE